MTFVFSNPDLRVRLAEKIDRGEVKTALDMQAAFDDLCDVLEISPAHRLDALLELPREWQNMIQLSRVRAKYLQQAEN